MSVVAVGLSDEAYTTCEVPDVCCKVTAVVSNDTFGAYRLMFIGVPHVPFDAIGSSGKLSGENGIAANMLLESVVVSSDEVYAVVALGEVPGVFGHSCPLHVSVDD